jgi:hypothetical protein
VVDARWPEIPGRPRLSNAHPDGDPSLSPDGHRALSAHRVFVSDEVLLDVSFPAARAGLASLIRGGSLGSASAQAYSGGITGLARPGPPGSAPGLPRLVQVHFQDLTATGDSARVALQWEAAEPAGGLFPALDADLSLTPAGEHSTTLNLTGVYRPPPGTAGPGLDRAFLVRCATATIRTFLHGIVEAIAVAAGPRTQAADPDLPRLPPEPAAP